MEQVLINHPKLKVHMTTGSEGPSHDPYAYQEYSVTTPIGEVVLHEGLGLWIKFNGKLINTPHGENYVRQHMFPTLTGYTVEQLERIAQRLRSRCSKCGGRSFHSEDGYPGEHFDVCDNCGRVNSSYFCESEII